MAPDQAEEGQEKPEKVPEGETQEGTKASDEGETEDTKVAPVPPAKLTVPITELPKPIECSTPRETRTNKEIIQEFRDSGLVADVIGGNVKPSGVSYEIRIDTVRVRPKTAKGFRVPKPPRRLESLGVKPAVDGEEKEKLAEKIEEKQKKAALRRQEMKESKVEKIKEKECKLEKALQFVSAANEKKKKYAAETIASKAERVKSARLCFNRQRKAEAEAKKRHRERVRRRYDSQKSPEVEYDKISTYSGSSTCSSSNGIVGRNDSSPLYYKTEDNLMPVKSDGSQDDFFDRPIGKGEDN